MNKFKFIDLFSGIGAFYQAMYKLGGKCVFASDIDERCIQVYMNNYHIDSKCDIRTIHEKDIPAHDLLCAGFPCQTFSKAGLQAGENDMRGTLFNEIKRILRYHHPKYVVLENVVNLIRNNNGKTWSNILASLKELGYRTTKFPLILSPHQFGVPQLRSRVFILGYFDPVHIDEPLIIKLPNLLKKEDNDIFSILDKNLPPSISSYEQNVLDTWEEFYHGLHQKTIGFPIWSEFFRKTYDESFPEWKKEFVRKNNLLYIKNKAFIDDWLVRHNQLKGFIKSDRKFEWQCGDRISSIYQGVIQFRPSGVRVKMPNVFPALVAMGQIPIIGKYKRRLTLKECSRLQSFSDNFIPDQNLHAAYKQFGNSANVKVIYTITKSMLGSYK